MSEIDVVPTERPNELTSLAVALALFPIVGGLLILGQWKLGLEPADNQHFLSPAALYAAGCAGIGMTGLGLVLAVCALWRSWRAGKRAWRLWLPLAGIALNSTTMAILLALMYWHSG
jgi:hypothetical protein